MRDKPTIKLKKMKSSELQTAINSINKIQKFSSLTQKSLYKGYLICQKCELQLMIEDDLEENEDYTFFKNIVLRCKINKQEDIKHIIDFIISRKDDKNFINGIIEIVNNNNLI